jgi:hypothetical protein
VTRPSEPVRSHIPHLSPGPVPIKDISYLFQDMGPYDCRSNKVHACCGSQIILLGTILCIVSEKVKVQQCTHEASHYTKAAQFHQPDVISSAKNKPKKITRLFHRPTQADEIRICFRRPNVGQRKKVHIFVDQALADKIKGIFSSACPRPTKIDLISSARSGRRKYRYPN